MKTVKDYNLNKKTTSNKLVKQMYESGGFTSKQLALGVDIIESMIKDKGSMNFLSFPAAICATGTRGIIREMVRRKWFDVLITTCGTLDHDIARSYKEYYHGDWSLDDKMLYKKGINRLGNILVPNASYGDIIEKKMMEWLNNIAQERSDGAICELSTHELCWELGKRMPKSSILYWCWKNKIPMIIPGPTDGSVGYQIWQYAQDHKFKLDLLGDETMLSNLTWEAKRSGALIIGGGISKHHVIWWNQFKKGLDNAVYISTALESDGSLSGARPREAVSWGKINTKANFTLIEADATLALPLIYSALLERI